MSLIFLPIPFEISKGELLTDPVNIFYNKYNVQGIRKRTPEVNLFIKLQQIKLLHDYIL